VLPTLGAVSEPLEPDPLQPAGGDTEEVDAVVVTPAAPALPAHRQAWTLAPAVQAAAVAATSFVAGAAAVGLVHRRQRRRELVRTGTKRRLSRGVGRGGSPRGAGDLLQIVGSRSLLVDVHLLGGRE
jgi:hypothetical protein